MTERGPAPPPSEPQVLHDKYGGTVSFTGRHLGHGTSRTPSKTRWFEVDIYLDVVVDELVVYTRGCTSVPGEDERRRVVRTDSPEEAIERLTVTHNGKTYLPRAARNALAQAAQWDDELAIAYRNREVE